MHQPGFRSLLVIAAAVLVAQSLVGADDAPRPAGDDPGAQRADETAPKKDRSARSITTESTPPDPATSVADDEAVPSTNEGAADEPAGDERPSDATPEEDSPPEKDSEDDSAPAAEVAPPSISGVLPDDEEPVVEGGPAKPSVILNEYGITAERFQQVTDGQDFTQTPQDNDLLLRLLLRLPSIPLNNFEIWTQKVDDLKQFSQSPQTFRGQTFHVEGRVVKVEKLKLPEREATRFDFDHLYRCDLLAGQPQVPAAVFTREIPRDWPVGKPLDERVSFNGIFVKVGAGSPDAAPIVFAAPHIAWHADTLLGDLGMDTGLFDNVVHGRALHSSERECFYKLLSTMKNAGTAELLRHARNDLIFRGRGLVKKQADLQTQQKKLSAQLSKAPRADDDKLKKELDATKRELASVTARIEYLEKYSMHEFIPLLEDPKDDVGRLRMFRGTAYRILRIRVTDQDIANRFGLTHYYQIDVMIALDRKVKLVAPSKEGPPKERVTWTHPATFCALELPEGMPVGDNVHENIRFAGFLFKSWGYPTEGAGADGFKWRSAPMIIGREPIWDEGPAPTISIYAGAIAGALFVLALTGVWIGVWRINRGDDRFHKSVIAKTYDIEDGVSLNELGLKADTVDFSYLAEHDSRFTEDDSASTQDVAVSSGATGQEDKTDA